MSDCKKRHSVSIGPGGSTAGSVSIGYALVSSLLLGSVLLVAAASSWLSMARERARVAVTWSVTRGDYVYRLRGRYSISSFTDGFATSIANDLSSQDAVSEVYVPAGLYYVTLEAGYTLERSDPSADGAPDHLVGAAVEVVPASLLSLNPVLVSAEAGGIARLGLSLVDMPGTAAEPESTCMNGT
jgi:hypothetical protein